MRDGWLVEVMPAWRFRVFDLSLVHLGNRHVSRPVRVFKEFAAQMAQTLFPALPARERSQAIGQLRRRSHPGRVDKAFGRRVDGASFAAARRVNVERVLRRR